MRTSIIVIAIVFLKTLEVHWKMGSGIGFQYPLTIVIVFVGCVLGAVMSVIQDIREIINDNNK